MCWFSSLFIYLFLWLHLQHREVPRWGTESKPKLWQCWILYPTELGQWPAPLSQVFNPLCHSGSSLSSLNSKAAFDIVDFSILLIYSLHKALRTPLFFCSYLTGHFFLVPFSPPWPESAHNCHSELFFFSVSPHRCRHTIHVSNGTNFCFQPRPLSWTPGLNIHWLAWRLLLDE